MDSNEVCKINANSAGKTNFLIFGNNTVAMKELLKSNLFKNKIKLIYIDPPFATNSTFRSGSERTSTISSSNDDEVAYTDNLVGKEYLDFLRERLILLRDLLSDDGSIYLHIDYKVGHYVKVLMDEVFGVENFINDITRIKSNPKNFSRKGYGNVKDMILFYSKKPNAHIWFNPREEFSKEKLEKLFTKIDSEGRRYTTNPLHAPGETKNGGTGKEWHGMKPPKGRHWRYSIEELEKLEKNNLIHWSKNGVPRKIIYAKDHAEKGMKKQDVWTFKDPQYPTYPTEKSLDLLELIIAASSRKEDYVLDAFCGSGTTLLAAEKHGRHWIGVDSSEVAIKKAKEKLLKEQSKFDYVRLI